MVAGHLREKSGYYYAVLNYTDALGKRKTKWIKTGLVGDIDFSALSHSVISKVA